MAARPDPPPEPAPGSGFKGRPADGGISIDRLAQAFAAMMGNPPAADEPAAADVVSIDASPDLDDEPAAADDDAGCRVTPLTILEALLFVGMPGGRPLAARAVTELVRGVRPDEVEALAAELRRRYDAEARPYEVAAVADGWVLRLRPEFARFGSVLEGRARMVRLDADSLDVLALVAWNQPVPRDRLVELGCDARPAVLRQLVRRGLLELRQPRDTETPPTYHTTPRFLEVFGLAALADLPDPSAPPP